MKRHLVFITLVILLVSCTDFIYFEEARISHLDKDGNITDKTPEGGELDVLTKTRIVFDNRANNYKVDVFSTQSRVYKVTGDVPPRVFSSSVPWFSTNESYYFYLTYYVNIAGVEIPIVPQGAHVEWLIAKDITNYIPVRNLESIVNPNTIIFPNDVYILIKNNTGTGIQFFSGTNIPQYPLNLSNSPTVNHNATAVYRTNNPNAVFSYNIREGNNFTSFSTAEGLTSFERGNIYELQVNWVDNKIQIELHHYRQLSLNNI